MLGLRVFRYWYKLKVSSRIAPKNLNMNGQGCNLLQKCTQECLESPCGARFRSSGISLPAEPELAASVAKNAGRRLTKVEIIDGKFHRDGQMTSGKFPGKIIGIGGNDYAPLAHDLGFEAFRTWGLDQLPWAMLEARKQDFKVMAGLDMTRDPQYYTEGSEHCFDNLDQSSYWQNAIRVILATVNRFKADTNMLMWLVGNELEIPINIEKGNDCMWKRVNWVARKVKDADPDHPVGIALAGIASPKVTKMSELCPEIDVLGTNIYGNEIRDIGSRLRAAGWTKPWAFTECGALGPWEVAQTSWGAPVELSSSRKGHYIYRGKRMCEEDEMCVAFMAFLWGWKWEKTGTWFGLINDWKESGANSFLNDIGQPIYDTFGPKDKRAFRIHIEGFKVDKDKEVSELGFAVDRGAEVQLDLLPVATPFDGDNGAWAHWVVTKESQVDAKSDANYHERPQAVIPNVVEGCPGSFRAKLKTWKLEEGNYRLYAFARRKHEGGFGHYPSTVEASFAIPFRVGPQMCSDVAHGHCFDEVNRVKTSAQRMGHNTWPAKGLRASSSFKEYQSALHVESHAGCPAPCSVQIPASATADCSVPTKLRYVADVAAIQELLAPPAPFELPDEECHTSIPHEDCYYATKWVMDQGRFTTNNFPELTADSSWEDGQLALWKRARNGCKKPCMESAETTQKAEEECHTSVPHEDCFYGTKWLLDEGRWKYPDAFPEVTVESTWEDAQEALWKRSKNGCKKPCRKEPEPTTTTTTTTTTTEEEMSGEPEETTTQKATEEECHTSVEPEDCFYGTKWLMDEGRWQHPHSFPEVTASSTWEDAQEALWKRSKNGCKKPCPHESESETEEEEPEKEEECHSSVPPEDCYYATKWLMDEGRWQHPHAFPEVTAHSTWEDAQAALWKRSEGSCKKPCAPESTTTTKAPETTTPEPEEESEEPEKEEELPEPEEDCYTSVEPEKCFYATKWLMEEGRYKYPDAFSEVTSESSWEDAQEALWKRGKDGCKKPCPHESADDIDKEECHNAVPPDDCYYATKWLLDEGRWQHPHSFPEVTAHSTFEDAQRALWQRSEGSCKQPCSEESEEQEKEEEKEEEEVPKEDCYTSVEPEKCFYATKWLMEEGRYKHPEAFPEVTPESSWEDAQTAFWKRGKDGCQKPCPHDSETLTDEVEEEDCHNSVPHEDCYYATKWLMDEGRWKHPEAFPEVTAASTWKDAQMALWKRSKDGCQKPCI
ncbi:CAT1 [Symbiodinium sp. CCMP2592]|nr:CAT1 [Symbiodinium sp. CCMP2592]